MFRHRSGSQGDRGRSRGRTRGGAAEDAERESARTEQAALIRAALEELRNTTVREVMTPRVDVVALPIPVSGEDVARTVRETGHSAFPVYNEHLDDLVGVLFVNDLFRAGWRSPRRPRRSGGAEGPAEAAAADSEGVFELDPVAITRRLRAPHLVPESGNVLDVLAEMREQRRAFAVVVDEHGGVEGVLTVKDLLGALVGDLPDEFDENEEPGIAPVDQRRWLVDGRTAVDDVAGTFGIEVPDGEYVTLGGYLFDALGHIPEEGEVLRLPGWDLRVAEMDRRRIAKVVFERTGHTGGPALAEEPRDAGGDTEAGQRAHT